MARGNNDSFNCVEIYVLLVKQPYASQIIEGSKTIEVRSRKTKIRGTIGIYATKTNDSTLDLPVGKLLGLVDLVKSSTYPVSKTQFFENSIFHHAPKQYFKEGKTYFWYFKNQVKFETPLEFKCNGSMVWSKLKI